MKGKSALAIFVSKATGFLSRKLGTGAGTQLPGRIALRIDPQLARKLSGELEYGTVLITGTNGKTTTANILANILRISGYKPIHNRSGANLMHGVTTALSSSASLSGKLEGNIGIFEIDEATLPQAVVQLTPRLVVITNLFRDQLDRYGELESLAAKMNKGLREISQGDLLLNADDPLVATLGEGTSLNISYFGISDDRAGGGNLQHAADSKNCRSCGEPLAFHRVYYAHMGNYHCEYCGVSRPELTFSANMLEIKGIQETRLTMEGCGSPLRLTLKIPGFYNVYNALAAAGAACILRLDRDTIVKGIEEYSTVFGRAEWIEAEGRKIFLVLSKNPAGFNEVIRTISSDGKPDKVLLMALNDRVADGTDVSWIWDVDFENLVPHTGGIIATGIRAEDMALRMKYAGAPTHSIAIEKKFDRALKRALQAVPPGGVIYALTTYTATLELRKVMTRLGYVKGYWEE